MHHRYYIAKFFDYKEEKNEDDEKRFDEIKFIYLHLIDISYFMCMIILIKLKWDRDEIFDWNGNWL